MLVLAILLINVYVGDAVKCEIKKDIKSLEKLPCEKGKCYKAKCKEDFKLKMKGCGDCDVFYAEMADLGVSKKELKDHNCKCEDSKDSKCDVKDELEAGKQDCGSGVTKCFKTECPKSKYFDKAKIKACGTCTKSKADPNFDEHGCTCEESDATKFAAISNKWGILVGVMASFVFAFRPLGCWLMKI